MRYLLTIALLFAFMGLANAAGIPTMVQPQHAPEIWTQEVYNNDSVELVSGTAVVWAMSSDTADTSFAYRTMWVDQTSSNDDINFAGIVISDGIEAGGIGTICIYGPVYARVADATDATTADHLVGTANTVEGQLGDGDSADNTATAGWCIYASPVALNLGGYGGTDGVDGYMQPIFIDKGYMSESTD